MYHTQNKTPIPQNIPKYIHETGAFGKYVCNSLLSKGATATLKDPKIVCIICTS